MIATDLYHFVKKTVICIVAIVIAEITESFVYN